MSGLAKTAAEMQKARNQVVNLIVNASVEMTRRAVRSVSEQGTLSTLKFLWEVAGMFPATSGTEGNGEAETKSVLKKLGLWDGPDEDEAEDEADADGNVESEETESSGQ